MKVNKKTDFVLIDSRAVDKKHRINLGAKIFGMRIPAHEKWLIDNPKRLKLFQKGIQDVIKGKVKEVKDLDEFLESL